MIQLVNRTPVAAGASFSDAETPAYRFLVVAAKATFCWDEHGETHIESQKPVPLFEEDEQTPDGVLPSDVYPRADPVFEVILLGKARAFGGVPVARRRVALTVGTVTHELEIFGDRVWLDRSRISDPVPFLEMPLTYARAYGGTAEVMVDGSTTLPLSDAMNKDGRGFDAEKLARDFCAGLQAPEGYPVLPGYRRHLPNLEDPANRIERWDDAPIPQCWATLPNDIGLRLKWAIDVVKAGSTVERKEMVDRAYHRAHPDWIIPLPPPSAPVSLLGIGLAERTNFCLPVIRPVADVLNGTETFSLPLLPQRLVLLPEQRRFYIVYRCVGRIRFQSEAERSVRVRLEQEWNASTAHPTSGS